MEDERTVSIIVAPKCCGSPMKLICASEGKVYFQCPNFGCKKCKCV
jgi:hypothetical protein